MNDKINNKYKKSLNEAVNTAVKNLKECDGFVIFFIEQNHIKGSSIHVNSMNKFPLIILELERLSDKLKQQYNNAADFGIMPNKIEKNEKVGNYIG